MALWRTWKFLEGGIALLGFISFSVTHSYCSETAWCKCNTKRFVIADSQPMVSWLPLVCIPGGLFTTIYGLRVNIFVQDLRETFIAMDVNGTKLNQRSFLEQSFFFDEMPNPFWRGCFCHDFLIQPFRNSKNALLCTAAQIKTLYCIFRSTDCTGEKHALQKRVLCVCACWHMWSAIDIACYGNHRWTPHQKGNFLPTTSPNDGLEILLKVNWRLVKSCESDRSIHCRSKILKSQYFFCLYSPGPT